MVIELAKPYDEEELKRSMQRAQYIPRPQAVRQKEDPIIEVAKSAGADVVGKVGMKGADMAMGKMFGPAITGGAATAPAVAGANLAATAGNVANAATIAGAGGASAAGAGAAGSGMMAGLAALGPIGLGLGGLFLAKRFGLFNHGGFVGPLGNMSKVKYKESGGDITQEYEINMGPLSKGV